MLDINSGCIHLVDDLVYEVLPIWKKDFAERTGIVEKSGDQYSKEDIRTSVSECEKLRRAGNAFYHKDVYENVIDDLQKSTDSSKSTVPAYCS